LKLADAESPLNFADALSEGQLYLTEKESLALNVLPLVSAEYRVGSAAADLIFSVLSILGSERESERIAISRSFLKNDKLGSGRGQPLRFQQ
jgi:hypothetical protein